MARNSRRSLGWSAVGGSGSIKIALRVGWWPPVWSTGPFLPVIVGRLQNMGEDVNAGFLTLDLLQYEGPQASVRSAAGEWLQAGFLRWDKPWRRGTEHRFRIRARREAVRWTGHHAFRLTVTTWVHVPQPTREEKERLAESMPEFVSPEDRARFIETPMADRFGEELIQLYGSGLQVRPLSEAVAVVGLGATILGGVVAAISKALA